MATVYLLKYNNYYNRIVKKEENLAGYLQDAYLLASFDNVNFVDSDGVDTTYLCNTQESPDYVVVANGNVILHRWFVIERTIMRNGQYRFSLHRDLIVDSYDAIVNAPCFIEKAKLQNNDPFIFNKEDMTFNQIKTSEYALKDETGCAWVVGYIPKDAFKGDAASRTVKGDVILEGGATADITVDNLQNWEYNQYAEGTGYKGAFTGNTLYAVYASSTVSGFQQNGAYIAAIYQDKSKPTYTSNNNPNIPGMPMVASSNSGFQLEVPSTHEQAVKFYREQVWKNVTGLQGELKKAIGTAYPYEEVNFQNLNGKIIYESASGLYRRVVVHQTPKNNNILNITSDYPDLYFLMNANCNKEGTNWSLSGTPDANSFKAQYSYIEYTITYEQIFSKATVTISDPDNRYHLEDQPYDMFCIPYSDTLVVNKNATQYCVANKSIAVNMATQIAAATGSANVYDVQLLPYCPARYCILPDGTFDIKNAKVDTIKKEGEEGAIGVILWVTTSAFTLDILHEIAVEDAKVESQTDMWRLTSPNFNGQFEFNAAKNGGVKSFNVDCNYKPFNPYIHINPNFGLLYGQDFNDARGLICGGDFSLPQISNAWANYQLNNKNYQAIFDRQIQNMEVNNRVQRIREITGAALSSAQAGIGGAVSGSMFGPVGAVVGGVASMAASAGGGAADVALNDQLRNEALDYKRDMFGYELGNIQALPTSITKTSAFTYNNKIFPILEYYTCTDKEKQALKDKIKYNGMTVMRIGTIGEFLGDGELQYIKGRIIRIDGIEDDFHYLKAIAEEIFKGAFFK